MNSSHVRGKIPVFLVALLLLSCLITVGVYSRSSRSQKRAKNHPRTYQPDKATVAPQVLSRIHGLQISGVTLINEGTPEAAVVIDVTNHRDEAVIALDFAAGKPETTSGGIAIDGSLASPARAVIPSHSLERFTWHLGGIIEGETVFLAAAIFSDGKEEGEQQSLDTIKRTRLESQQKRRDETPTNGGRQ